MTAVTLSCLLMTRDAAPESPFMSNRFRPLAARYCRHWAHEGKMFKYLNKILNIIFKWEKVHEVLQTILKQLNINKKKGIFHI